MDIKNQSPGCSGFVTETPFPWGSPMRSFTLLHGSMISSLAATSATAPAVTCRRRRGSTQLIPSPEKSTSTIRGPHTLFRYTMGVRPMSCVTLSAMLSAAAALLLDVEELCATASPGTRFTGKSGRLPPVPPDDLPPPHEKQPGCWSAIFFKGRSGRRTLSIHQNGSATMYTGI